MKTITKKLMGLALAVMLCVGPTQTHCNTADSVQTVGFYMMLAGLDAAVVSSIIFGIKNPKKSNSLQKKSKDSDHLTKPAFYVGVAGFYTFCLGFIAANVGAVAKIVSPTEKA